MNRFWRIILFSNLFTQSSNACRLLFKFAKNEVNDGLFMRCDLVTPLLETLSTTRLSSAEDGIVYAAGALKFLSGNPDIAREMTKRNAVETMGKIVREGMEDVIGRENATETNNAQSMAVITNALVQITSTVRRLVTKEDQRKTCEWQCT